MYWDSLTVTGAYVAVFVSVCVIYLCRQPQQRRSRKR